MLYSLQSKIILLFITLLLLVEVVSLSVTIDSTHEQAIESIGRQLDVGKFVFNDKLESRQEFLQKTVNALTRDFVFQQLFVDVLLYEADEASSLHASLVSQRERVGADFAAAFDLQGNSVVSTIGTIENSVEVRWLIESHNELKDAGPMLISLNDSVYQVVLAPVKAPAEIGWLVVGYEIDEPLANYFKYITGLEVSFVRSVPGQQPKLIASTLSPEAQISILDQASWEKLSARRSIFYHGAQSYLSLRTPGSRITLSPIEVILQRDMGEELARFDSLKSQLLAITAFTLVLAMVGAYLISRGITRPIRELTQVARRIGAGEYDLKLDLKDRGETGILAREFSNMQRGIFEREKAIEYLAYHDDLTGIPNLHQFRSNLATLVRDSKNSDRTFGVCVINIDGFREINDILGHSAGDEIIIQLARRLTGLAPDSGCLARTSGDEFALVVPEVNGENYGDALLELERQVNQSITINDFQLEIHCRAGIAFFPSDGTEPLQLLRNADLALSDSKAKRVFVTAYDSRQENMTAEMLGLMSELRSTIENDGLTLFYQPKLDLARNEVSHVEALVRWLHPTHGQVFPDQFIPYAEQTGIIRDLTRWALRTAAQQHLAWRMRGLDITIAVNISAMDLADSHLLNFLQELLEDTGIKPQALVLEITESAVMQDPERSRLILQELRDIGFGLSIDDFGTGYSSMAQIKHLTADNLKIDKSFVLNLDSTPEDEVIVRSTIELGHNMDMKIVAEGVENEASLNMLREFGCNYAQGYFICRPISATDLDEWFNTTQQYPPRSLAKQAAS